MDGAKQSYSLYAVRIFVTDFDRALRFYRERLGMETVFCGEDVGWAEFDTGGARLALERADPQDPESMELVGRFVGVSLQVDDITQRHRELAKRGVEFVAPPEKQPWGGTLAHLKDPDGNVLTLLGS